MIKRLQSRKGFTIIELIVVLGIIAVLSAIMLPMFANSGKPQEAAAKAKSFYYAAQSVFIEYKASNTDAAVTDGYFKFEQEGATKCAKDAHDGKNATYLYVMAHAEPEKGFTSVELSVSENGKTSVTGYECMHTPAVQTSGELLDALNSYSTTDDYGYYYALVDSQCRVLVSYWSQDDINILSDSGTGSGAFSKSKISFTSNDTIGSSIVGSYPTSYSANDMDMFFAG